MAVHYNNLMLGYDHCRATDDLMASIVPKLEKRSLAEIAIRMYTRMKRLEKDGRITHLLEIAEDNQVSQEEESEFDSILLDVMEFVEGGLELKMYGKD